MRLDDPDTEREIAAIRERMLQPVSREQIVANELCRQIEVVDRPIADWTNDDWLRLARQMIETVESPVTCRRRTSPKR
jgi:hypothetical protein